MNHSSAAAVKHM